MNYLFDFSIKSTKGGLFSPSREYFAWIEINGIHDSKTFTKYGQGTETEQQALKRGVIAHIKTLDNPQFWVDAPWEKVLRLQKFLEIEEDFLCFRSFLMGHGQGTRYDRVWTIGGNGAKCKYLKKMLDEQQNRSQRPPNCDSC